MEHLWSLSNMTRVHVDSGLPYILLNKAKVIESFSFGVYRCILKNKIDKISLTLTMFVGYHKFKTAFKKFGNFYLLN